METLLLLIDSIAMAVLLYFSLRNDRLKPGEPQIGVFRYVETATPKKGAESLRRAGARR